MALSKNFVGAQKPLDDYDIPRLAHRINVTENRFKAFFIVESGGKPFDAMGRPSMLFEPHVFYRNLPAGALRDRAVAEGLAYPKWRKGNYPKDSYPRLIAAMKIDKNAALKACSIGLSQVLVENHVSVGYRTPEAMWQAFMDDVENHVEAMMRFILANNIDDDLRAGRWMIVSKVYNGPRYAENGYHTKMKAAFEKLEKNKPTDWKPDGPEPTKLTISDPATLRTVQNRLIEIGYPEVGRPDGKWGSKTRAAVLGFRADVGLPIVADVDKALLSALMVAEVREVSDERANTTATDLAERGSRKVIAVGNTTAAGYVTVAGGAVAAVGAVSDQIDSAKGMFSKVGELGEIIEVVRQISPWLLLAVGAYVVYQQWIVKKAVVEDYRTGRYVGR